MIGAVLTAAGGGHRLGAGIPKGLVEIHGKPMVRWALEGLLNAGSVDMICVSVPGDYVNHFEEILRPLSSSVSLTVVSGGDSRQASVRAALTRLRVADLVLVHDAARPFASPELINRVIDTVSADRPAVVPGLPVTDTIKEVGEGAVAQVVSTPPRAFLRAIQTPQGFINEVLWQAHQDFRSRGKSENEAATDDAMLVEWSGRPVYVCEGDDSAFKITTANDLSLAEDFLNSSFTQQ